MLKNSRGSYPGVEVTCDLCGTELEANTFEEALEDMRFEGWQAIKTENGWEHYCSECKKK